MSRRGIELGTEHGLDEARDLFTLIRGAALVHAKRTDEGLAMLREGFGRYTATAARLASPMFTMFVVSCLEVGAFTEGLAVVERALVTSRRQNARSLELRAAASLARLRQDRGDLEGARDLLAPIVASFEQGLDTPDLRAANQLLRELDPEDRHAG